MTTKRIHQAGFTIIELMVATTVFSFVLLICTYGIIKVGNDYYKGITEARTQENARDTIDRITQDIQFSGGAVVPIGANGASRGFCIGEHRYSFLLDKQLVNSLSPGPDQAKHVMIVDSPSSACATNSPLDVAALPQFLNDPAIMPALQSPEELASLNVRIKPYATTMIGTPIYEDLIWSQPGSTGVYTVGFKFVYGDDDFLTPTHEGCAGGAGIQFCAVSTLLSTVQKRINP